MKNKPTSINTLVGLQNKADDAKTPIVELASEYQSPDMFNEVIGELTDVNGKVHFMLHLNAVLVMLRNPMINAPNGEGLRTSLQQVVDSLESEPYLLPESLNKEVQTALKATKKEKKGKQSKPKTAETTVKKTTLWAKGVLGASANAGTLGDKPAASSSAPLADGPAAKELQSVVQVPTPSTPCESVVPVPMPSTPCETPPPAPGEPTRKAVAESPRRLVAPPKAVEERGVGVSPPVDYNEPMGYIEVSPFLRLKENGKKDKKEKDDKDPKEHKKRKKKEGRDHDEKEHKKRRREKTDVDEEKEHKKHKRNREVSDEEEEAKERKREAKAAKAAKAASASEEDVAAMAFRASEAMEDETAAYLAQLAREEKKEQKAQKGKAAAGKRHPDTGKPKARPAPKGKGRGKGKVQKSIAVD